MPRKVHDAALASRQKRLKLKAGQRYWSGIREGVALGYRCGTQGVGSWSLRLLLADGRYVLRVIGDADDHGPADGTKVLNFAQAQKRATTMADQIKNEEGSALTPAILAEAAERYLAWFRKRDGAGRRVGGLAHIPPGLSNRRVGSLTALELRAWLDDIAA
jgi:hypothetical protein